MALIIEQNLCVLKVSYALCFHSNSQCLQPHFLSQTNPLYNQETYFFVLNKCVYALTSMLGFHAYINASLVLHSKIPNEDH